MRVLPLSLALSHNGARGLIGAVQGFSGVPDKRLGGGHGRIIGFHELNELAADDDAVRGFHHLHGLFGGGNAEADTDRLFGELLDLENKFT